MIHMYAAKKFHRAESAYEVSYKLLCNRQKWITSRGLTPNPVTVPVRVTCPDCLQIIIPKRLSELQVMQNNLALVNQADRSSA